MRIFHPDRPEAVINVADATGLFAGMKGLLGTAGLNQGWGMLVKAKNVHTIGMKFAIDAVYLSGDFTILRIKTLIPRRIGPILPAGKWVLELPAGEAGRLGFKKGDRLMVSGDGP